MRLTSGDVGEAAALPFSRPEGADPRGPNTPPYHPEAAWAALDAFLRRIDHDVVSIPQASPGQSTLAMGWNGPVSEEASSSASDIIVFQADAAEMQPLLRRPPRALIVEREQPRWISGLGPAGMVALRASGAYKPGKGERPLTITVAGDGRRLAGVKVVAYWRSAAGYLVSVEDLTDRRGVVKVPVGRQVEVTVLVEPFADFWPMQAITREDEISVECPRIVADGPAEWWRDFISPGAREPDAGAGIRVGIIDSGVGPHPLLEHVLLDRSWGAGSEAGPTSTDLRGHGTHVAGLIGARGREGQFRGLAPAADITAMRVFGARGATSQATVAQAIQAMADLDVHLINLSLSAPTRSRVEEQEIEDAWARGVLCIAASGNTAGAVEYPAAYKQVVAVAACGRLGTWLPGTVCEGRMPAVAPDFGVNGLFGANFSNRGRDVVCVAPGVAIASTVARAPDGAGFAVMDGTSMAAPLCTGALAVALSRDPNYLSMDATRERPELARRVLRRILSHTGLSQGNWGAGAPRL